MTIPLAEMVKRTRNTRRRAITLRPIRTPAMLATDLYHVIAPVVAAWERTIPSLVAEYERTLAEMTQDSPVDVHITLERTDAVVATILATIRDRLARWASRFEQQHRQRWTATVLTATGVDLRTMIGPARARMTLEAVIERNVELVRNVSEQARGRIADAVFRGFTSRTPAVEIARELREAIAMGRRRARLIASDQTNKLAAALDQERRREVGIETWIWIHSAKQHPREEHVARDGVEYSDDKPPPDMPGELPFCGCTSRAVLHLD